MQPEEAQKVATMFADPRWKDVRQILARYPAAEWPAVISQTVARVRREVWRDFSPPKD